MRVMLCEVTKRFGREPVLEQITLTFESSTRWGLVGPSGAGKTTLLRMIAGLERPTAGKVSWEKGEHVVRPCGIGFVFQELGLWPHVTARDHVEYVLEGPTASSRRERAAELLEEVQLPSNAWSRRPGELSGGEAQRVAIARALAIQPSLLVLDEPFVQLHAALRAELCELVNDVVRRRQATLICVSHAWRDLQSLCDHLAVLVKGRLVQTGSCDQVYRQPRSAEVARLTGPCLSIPASWLTQGQVTQHTIMKPPDSKLIAYNQQPAEMRHPIEKTQAEIQAETQAEMQADMQADMQAEVTSATQAELRLDTSTPFEDEAWMWTPPRTADGTLIVRPQQIVLEQPMSPNRWQVRSCQLLGAAWRLELVGKPAGETVDAARPTWDIPFSSPIRPGTMVGVGIRCSSQDTAVQHLP